MKFLPLQNKHKDSNIELITDQSGIGDHELGCIHNTFMGFKSAHSYSQINFEEEEPFGTSGSSPFPPPPGSYYNKTRWSREFRGVEKGGIKTSNDISSNANAILTS